jgi:hypothetical protein
MFDYERIGQQELGKWPVVRRNGKGHVRVIIPHHTPGGYRRSRFIANIVMSGIFSGWCYLTYQVFITRHIHAPWPHFGVTWWVGAFFTMLAPLMIVERRMARHHKSGHRLVITFKNGQMTWGGIFGAKIALGDIHSIVGRQHTEGQDEERHESDRLRRSRKPREEGRTPRIYRDASELLLHTGYGGARTQRLLEIVKDRNLVHAGLARAAILFGIDAVIAGAVTEETLYGARPSV